MFFIDLSMWIIQMQANTLINIFGVGEVVVMGDFEMFEWINNILPRIMLGVINPCRG